MRQPCKAIKLPSSLPRKQAGAALTSSPISSSRRKACTRIMSRPTYKIVILVDRRWLLVSFFHLFFKLLYFFHASGLQLLRQAIASVDDFRLQQHDEFGLSITKILRLKELAEHRNCAQTG